MSGIDIFGEKSTSFTLGASEDGLPFFHPGLGVDATVIRKDGQLFLRISKEDHAKLVAADGVTP